MADRTCVIKGCGGPQEARGWCKKHYQRWRKHGDPLRQPYLHGHTKWRGPVTPEYRAWVNMRQRCLNPRSPQYDRYGGRGITVCERWNSFVPFLADVGFRPSPVHSLDRIDNDGNYEPGNIR